MKAKFRKRAMLHCTATSSTQHIKKLWSLNKKCKSYQANCEILSKSKMAAAYFQFPWQPMGKNIFFQNFLNYNHTRVFTVKKIVNTSIIEDFRKKHQQMALITKYKKNPYTILLLFHPVTWFYLYIF